jgi:formate hydrogenlyase subunit 4
MRDILIHLALLVVLPPFLPGLIQKTKAWFAGRQGAPLLQPYRDIWKLLRKGAVVSRTTTWLFRAGPVVGLATVMCAGLIVPFHCAKAPLGFEGDVIVFAYLLGLGRFFTMLAALDTGSSFEGMGSSREAAFSALAEPALFLSLAIICLPAGSASFQDAWSMLPGAMRFAVHPEILAAAIAVFIVLLTENSRVPVDDPNTHLELTMVHEVMVLDHGGPDLAFIEVASAVKFLVISSLLTHILLPIPPDGGWVGLAIFLGGTLGLTIAVGLLESLIARLRMVRVPQFLVAASVFGAVGLLVALVGGAR